MLKQKYSTCLLPAAFIWLLAACSKKDDIPGTASLTIVNAVVNSNPLVLNFSGTSELQGSYLTATYFFYGVYYDYSFGGLSGNQISSRSGPQTLAVYQFPDTLPTSVPLFNLRFNMPIGSINSLYLTGTVNSPDTVFIVDHPPYHAVNDSSMGIRFVNLSRGSTPVSVNIQGQSNGSTVSNLPYKSVTGFLPFSATSGISSYSFEFRDAATGTLLATYVLDGIDNDGTDPNNPFNNRRFHNFTLALLGLPNGTDMEAQTVLLIYNS